MHKIQERPVAIAGMSTRPTGLPRTVHSLAGFRLAVVLSGMLNFFPPTSSP